MSGNDENKTLPPPSYSEAISDPRYLATGAAAVGEAQPYPSPPSGAAQTPYSSAPTVHPPPAPTGYQGPPTSYQGPPTSYQGSLMGYQAPPTSAQALPSSPPFPGQPGYQTGGFPAQTTVTYTPQQGSFPTQTTVTYSSGNVPSSQLPQGFATTPLAYSNPGQRQNAARVKTICLAVVCCFIVVSVFIITMSMALG